jgi:signal transduction histidine kinase
MSISIKLNIIIAITALFAILAVIFFANTSGWPLFYIVLSFCSMGIIISYVVNDRVLRPTVRFMEEIRKIMPNDANMGKRIAPADVADLTAFLQELKARLEAGEHKHKTREKEIDKAKTDFVALASHQLRTPLSIIKWYVDFMLEEDAGPLNPDQKRYLKEVYKSNEHLIQLVNALLDASRIDVGTFAIKPEPSDLVAIVEEAVKSYDKELAEKNIKFVRDFDQTLPVINVDPKLTKVVFQNLLDNSVKYTPENGVIGIEIKKSPKDLLIEVYDNGCGIPFDSRPKIFSKLYRAENVKKLESEGTGLGLYIVKAIVEKSGGKIWFESLADDKSNPVAAKDNGGKIAKSTIFYISIPLKGMIKKSGSKELTGMRG